MLSLTLALKKGYLQMFLILVLFSLLIGTLNRNDMWFIACGLFSIACAIEQFTYKYFKNK